MIKFCYGEEADIKTISDKNAIIATSDTNKFYAKIDGVVHQMSDPIKCLSTDSVSNLINGKLYFETDTSKLFYLYGTAKIYTNSGSAESGSNITVDTELSSTSTNPVQNKVIKEALDEKVSAIDGKGLSTEDFTTEEKEKLSSLKNTAVDTELSETSENPVENKVINSALNGKVDRQVGKGLSTEDFTTEEKKKLSGLEKITIDSTLNDTSTNPVQNKVIYEALQNATGGATVIVDSDLSENSTNPVQNKVITSALNKKANTEDAVTKKILSSNDYDALSEEEKMNGTMYLISM